MCALSSWRENRNSHLLPPAYVVRREGNVFDTRLSFHLVHPYPIMFCNITQNSMGQTPGGGVPCPVQLGAVPCQGGLPCRGVPFRGVPFQGVKGYPAWGVPCPGRGTLPGGYPGKVPPSQVRRGGTLPGGYPAKVPPPPARSGWGGTQVGQQKEYSIHGGRYASCVHAGTLFCLIALCIERRYLIMTCGCGGSKTQLPTWPRVLDFGLDWTITLKRRLIKWYWYIEFQMSQSPHA